MIETIACWDMNIQYLSLIKMLIWDKNFSVILIKILIYKIKKSTNKLFSIHFSLNDTLGIMFISSQLLLLI